MLTYIEYDLARLYRANVGNADPQKLLVENVLGNQLWELSIFSVSLVMIWKPHSRVYQITLVCKNNSINVLFLVGRATSFRADAVADNILFHSLLHLLAFPCASYWP